MGRTETIRAALLADGTKEKQVIVREGRLNHLKEVGHGALPDEMPTARWAGWIGSGLDDIIGASFAVEDQDGLGVCGGQRLDQWLFAHDHYPTSAGQIPCQRQAVALNGGDIGQ